MTACRICGKPAPSQYLRICPECAKTEQAKALACEFHQIPKIEGEVFCSLCSNRCKKDTAGLCGLRWFEEGRTLYPLTVATRGFAKAVF